MAIFNFFGNILGYLLWFLYSIFQNYGVAIIFFTIILKLLMFPMSLKQQKSMASQSRMAAKQQEIKDKYYSSNKQKYNEELSKLYEKEGINPASGCLTTLIPFPIMLGIYYSVVYPLTNTLHIASEKITAATEYIKSVMTVDSQFYELALIKNFDSLKSSLTMFDAADIEKIEFFCKGFRFLGLDLLATPSESDFFSFLWIIPVLSLVTSFGYQFYMSRKSGGASQQKGCMKVMLYVFPLISVYWAFIMPAAVGFYWVMSSVTSSVQSIITNKYFSAEQMEAKNEAVRVATLELAESSVKPLPPVQQQLIAERLEASRAQNSGNKAKESPAGNSKNKRGKKK